MDFATFLIRLIEAIAWPTALVAIVILFRHEIRDLSRFVRRLKAGPISAEFDFNRNIDELRELADETTKDSQAEEDLRGQMLSNLARVNPRSAVLEAWAGVESSVRKAAIQVAAAESPPPDIHSALSAIRILTERQSINSEDQTLFYELRGLRNQAAHLDDFDLSIHAALDYARLARELQSRLDAIAGMK